MAKGRVQSLLTECMNISPERLWSSNHVPEGAVADNVYWWPGEGRSIWGRMEETYVSLSRTLGLTETAESALGGLPSRVVLYAHLEDLHHSRRADSVSA